VTYDYYRASSAVPPNIGQLKSVTTSTVASTAYSYNTLGEVAESTHTISGFPGDLTFAYDWYLTGALKGVRYPSGRRVYYGTDDAGRTDRVYMPGKSYVDMTGITNPYTPDGRMAQMELGNGLWETRDYQNHQTLYTSTIYSLGNTPGGGEVTQLEYRFSPDENNGNVEQQIIHRQGFSGWTQAYEYDGANRLSSASETGGFGRTYDYDRHGNRYYGQTCHKISFKNPRKLT
jgi:YD repeat-containing protein